MHWFCALAFLAAVRVPVGLAAAIVPRWDDVRVKHSWGSIPARWELYGRPPAGATIDLHVVLKPYRDNALIDTLYEVSDPNHPKYVTSPSSSPSPCAFTV
jgi:tripeptidyl-peptidase-1